MEQMDELRRPEAKTRLMYQIVCGASGAVILLVLSYGAVAAAAVGSASQFGASLVEASFPSSVFAEPVTYLSVAGVTFFYAGLRLWQNKVARWSHVRLATLQLLAIVVAFCSAYEVSYSFMVWGSYYSAQLLGSVGSPTGLATNLEVPWTVVFGAKAFGALLLISGYSVYFLRKVHSVRGLTDF